MATYNGHKNWNHWNVALWIANDEGLYGMAMSAILYAGTRDDAARSLLGSLPSATPDGAPYSFTTVRAALRGL
jgi:hypothetical protein